MSLLNQVLRQLDQQQGSGASSPVPPVATAGRDGGRRLWLVAGLMAVAAAAAGGWWWGSAQRSLSGAAPTEEAGSDPQAAEGTAPGKESGGEVDIPAAPPQDPPGKAAESGSDNSEAEPDQEGAEEAGREEGSDGRDGPSEETTPGQGGEEPFRLAPVNPPKRSVSGDGEQQADSFRRPTADREKADDGEGGAAAGYRLLQQGDAEAARRRLERAAERTPEPGPGLLNNLALAQWRSGARQDALATFRRGLKAHPGDRRLAHNLGRLALSDSNRERRLWAVRILTEAQASRGSAGRLSLIGGLSRSLGELEAAERAYRGALETQEGGGWRSWLGLALTLERAGKAGEARQAYARALEGLPEEHGETRNRIRRRLEDLRSREAD